MPATQLEYDELLAVVRSMGAPMVREPLDPSKPADQLEIAYGLANMLSGEVYLVPVVDGAPNFKPSGLDELEQAPWTAEDFTTEDAARLCILTENFSRFDSSFKGSQTALITHIDRDDRRHHHQIAGDASTFAQATAILDRGLSGDRLREWAPLNVPASFSTPANDNTPAALRAPVAEPLEFVDPTTWQGQDVPVMQWYVPKLIPSRTVTLLSGDGGLGKSLIALQLSIASALSCDAMGMTPAPCKVLYVGAEDEVAEFHRRIASILKATSHEFADLAGQFLLLPLAEKDATLAAPDRAGKMQPTPLMAGLVDKICAFEPGLIVLDTSADLFGGDEIKRSQVRQFVGMLRTIAISTDCAVLLLSHPSVSGMEKGTGTSGSTAWNNSVRSRLYLTAPTGAGADGDTRLLSVMKANYGKKGALIGLLWESGLFVPLDDADDSPAIGILNGRDDAKFLSLLGKMDRQGQNVSASSGTSYAPSHMAKHPDGKGLTKEAFKRAMHRLLDAGTIKVITYGPPSHVRKRLIISADDFGA